METNTKEIAKWFAFLSIFAILMITVFLFGITILDNFDLLGFNTPKQEPSQIIHLAYPPYETFAYEVKTFNGTIEKTPLLTIDIALFHTGDLVEGSKVDVSAVGLIYPKGREIIASPHSKGAIINFEYGAVLGFEGATIYKELEAQSKSPGGEFPVNLQPDMDYLSIQRWNQSSPWPHYQTIKWDTQGDYYPMISIPLKNGTTLEARYPNKIIHVGGSDVIRQERYAKISTWLSLAILALTIVTSAELLFRVLPTYISDLIGSDKKGHTAPKGLNGSHPKTDQLPNITRQKNNRHKKDR
ncbi:MAG: hypothetical protein WC379_12605 [Methanoregula sp.]|jgi:hypothetical protein